MLGWLDRWLSAWNEHDLDTLTPLVAEDLLWADPIMIGRYVRGRDEFRKYVQTFWTGFPDIVFEPIAEPFIGVAGMRMMVQWRMTGTLTGPLAWWGTRQGEEPPTWAPTGRPADITGCDIYEFRDGQLAKYTDPRGLPVALPAAGADATDRKRHHACDATRPEPCGADR